MVIINYTLFFFKFCFVHTIKNIWIAIITWWYSVLFCFSFCFVQALKTFRLDWRISLLSIDTYMPRLVCNPLLKLSTNGEATENNKKHCVSVYVAYRKRLPVWYTCTRMYIIIQYAYIPKRMYLLFFNIIMLYCWE